jgi:hypothetical protein
MAPPFPITELQRVKLKEVTVMPVLFEIYNIPYDPVITVQSVKLHELKIILLDAEMCIVLPVPETTELTNVQFNTITERTALFINKTLQPLDVTLLNLELIKIEALESTSPKLLMNTPSPMNIKLLSLLPLMEIIQRGPINTKGTNPLTPMKRTSTNSTIPPPSITINDDGATVG